MYLSSFESVSLVERASIDPLQGGGASTNQMPSLPTFPVRSIQT
jgi:hypothetical protein